MATEQTPLQQNIGSAGSITALLNALRGKTDQQITTSGGGSTTQRVLDEDTLAAILSKGLQSTQGLAAVTSGQKTAGLYNTSTNQLLTNDLLARLTTEAAIAGAPQVVTNQDRTQTTRAMKAQGGNSLLPLAALGLGAGVAAGEKGRKALGEGDLAGFGNSVLENLGLTGGGSGAALNLAATPTAMSFAPGTIAAEFGASAAPMMSFAPEVSAASAVSAAPSFLDTNLFGSTTVGDALPYTGAVLNLLQGDVEGAVGAGLGTWLGSMTPLGPIGGAIGGFIGDALFGGDGGCFITTAAVDILGKADDCDELQTLRNFRDTWMKENHPGAIVQYYEEAPRIVEVLKNHPDANKIFNYFWECYILPAVDEIKEGKFKDAYFTYVQLFNVAGRMAEGH